MPDVRELRLDPSVREALANGCGSKGGWKVPDWIREAILLKRAWCDEHDLAYAIGGTEKDRRKADAKLAGRLVIGSFATARPWRWVLGLVAAFVVYRGVRRFGDRTFHYGEPRSVRQLEEMAGEKEPEAGAA